MALLVIVSIAIEILSKIELESSRSNFFLLHFYTVIEFTFISLFYINFFKSYFKPTIGYIGILLFLGVATIDYRINGIEAMDDFSVSVECITFIAYSLFLFYFILKNLLYNNLLSEPVFWTNSAILVYFSGNLLLFVFNNYLLKTAPTNESFLWSTIHSFFNIVYNIILAIGFWKTRPK
jgi:hypothetical protein